MNIFHSATALITIFLFGFMVREIILSFRDE